VENQSLAPGTLLRGPAAYRPQTPWGAIAAGVATVVIMGAGAVAAVLVLGSGVVSSVPDGAQWSQDANLLATLAIWQVFAIVLTLGASALFGGNVRDVLALRPPAESGLVYVKAIILMAALQIAVGSLQYLFYPHDMYADLRPLVRLFGDQWLLALLVVGVGAPLSEELMFRGFLLSALARSRVGFWGGTIITTTWWTALHAGYSTVGIAEVFLIGIFFSWLLWRTGSLLVPIFCHALYNSFIVVALRYVPLPS
jgi:uncharacterized protein